MPQIKRILLLCYCWILTTRAYDNNVCKNYIDYATIAINKNCWFNPDVDSTPEDMIRRNGYPFEAYTVTTEDGYNLALYRIPHDNYNVFTKRQPVLLQHGASSTCEIWIDKGRKRSLAYNLVDMGFDVWLGNFRGNPHSMSHMKFKPDSREFWNFSFHEFGYYDLPALINFISATTNTKGQIIYVGHSMGTSAAIIYSILRKEEAERNLIGLVSLGPYAYFLTVTPFLVFAPFAKNIENALAFFNRYAMFHKRKVQKHLRNECIKFPITKGCELLMFLMVGFNPEQVLPEEIPVIFSYIPVGISMKTIIHTIQQRRNGGNFQFFDYGRQKNLRLYGSSRPPQYDLKKMSLPVHLLYGKNDLLTTEEAAIRLYNSLNTTKSITYIAPDGSVDFNHLDFVYAKNITELLYPTLFNIINSLRVRYDYNFW